MPDTDKTNQLEQLLHAINHDLRTPLGNIRSATAILLQDLSTQITEEQRIFIEIIDRSTIRLLDQSNRLLLFSQIAFGQTSPEHIRLSELLANVKKSLKNNYAVENVTLSNDSDPLVPCHNYTLPMLLALLAVGDTKQQAETRPEEFPTIQTTTGNNQIQFTVHSQMPAQELASSFDELTSIIVALHGGNLERTAENGRLRFTFTLPLAQNTN